MLSPSAGVNERKIQQQNNFLGTLISFNTRNVLQPLTFVKETLGASRDSKCITSLLVRTSSDFPSFQSCKQFDKKKNFMMFITKIKPLIDHHVTKETFHSVGEYFVKPGT